MVLALGVSHCMNRSSCRIEEGGDSKHKEC